MAGEDNTLPDTMPGLNIQEGLRLVAGKEKIYRRLIAVFSDAYQQDSYNMRKLVDAHQHEEAARVAHSLKGVGGNLGAERLKAVAMLMDEAYRDDDLAQVPHHLDEFESAIAEVVSSITALQQADDKA